MHRLRARALDVFLVLLAAAEAASVLLSDSANRPVVAALSALSALVLLGRHWQPLAASIAAFALLAVGSAVQPRITIVQFFGVLATFAVTGAINRDREAVAAWLAGAGMLGYAEWSAPNAGGIGDYALTLAFATTMWGAGVLVRHRTRDTAAAVLRAEAAERDRQEQARRAVAEERARLARELHDIVSHGLSVVVLQTVAARAALQDGGDDGEVDQHLDAVEDTARDALGEMRRMLGLLQVDGQESALSSTPSPGLRSLPALVERATAAGLRIDVIDLARDAELPSGLELAIYRVVQEALTNAAKHAPGSSVRVAVQVDDGTAVVTVINDAGTSRPEAPEGAGQGLIGMRQRAELYGGGLRTGPTKDGGFAVTATFRLDDAPAPAVPHR